MSYISDYDCGAMDYDEYCQFAAEENRRDRIDREMEYGCENEQLDVDA